MLTILLAYCVPERGDMIIDGSDGEVLETTMDDIEISIARRYPQ